MIEIIPHGSEMLMSENSFYKALDEEHLYAQLSRSREEAANGGARSADEVIRDMRAKYGL